LSYIESLVFLNCRKPLKFPSVKYKDVLPPGVSVWKLVNFNVHVLMKKTEKWGHSLQKTSEKTFSVGEVLKK